jgi:WD repeat-containing protein 19
MIQEQNLVIWSPVETLTIETGMKQLDIIDCSPQGDYVSIVSKSNVFFYHYKSKRKIPVYGKHQKQITGSGWSNSDQLALCSFDRSITISNAEGDTTSMISLKGDPSLLKVMGVDLVV